MAKTVGEKFLRSEGLNPDDSTIKAAMKLTPALDIVRTRPTDAAYSEFGGLVKHMVRAFVYEALIPKYLEDLSLKFVAFRIPPGWPRLQLIHHLDNWRMTECAEATIIMPVLLRCWLKNHHIRHNFGVNLMKHAPSLISDIKGTWKPVDIITYAFWLVVKANMIIAGRETPRYSREYFDQVVKEGRKAIQLMFHVSLCGRGKDDNKSADHAAVTVEQSVDVEIASNASSVASFLSDITVDVDELDVNKLKSGKKYIAYNRMKGLPNIHIGLHHWDVVMEYGACRLVFTFLGEDKHRFALSPPPRLTVMVFNLVQLTL